MKRIFKYTFSRYTIVLLLVFALSCCSTNDVDFSERTKIALRDAGNKLLLSKQDSISLILPVIEMEANTYQLTFSKPLAFEPNILVTSLQQSLNASQLPEHYRVEVLQCTEGEVAYSYQMSAEKESTIIPCAGRYLPESCYIIKVKFINHTGDVATKDTVYYTIIFLVLIGLGFLIVKKIKKVRTIEDDLQDIEKIGSFYFYPEQNKLVKESEEIALSKKECELLALFVANPNQIIKRDELTKRVWEDNGVFVGRSLDTYISKLRKKLKSDTSIKLTNVHGIGYKLEIK